jgi:very-short-patch-repair endonuclease
MLSFAVELLIIVVLVLLRHLYLSERRKRDWSVGCQSYIEERLYFALSNRGYYAETQVSCGSYRIDITLPDYGIAIECDGYAFHSSPEQKKHDYKKNRYLKKRGWSVYRFTGSEIVKNLPKVVGAIENSTLNRN